MPSYSSTFDPELADALERCRLRVLFVAPFKGDPQVWNHPATSRDFSAIYLCLDGDGYVRSRGRTFPMERGRVIVMPAGDIMDLGCRTLVHKWSVCFTLTLHSGRDLAWGLPSFDGGSFDPDEFQQLMSDCRHHVPGTLFRLQADIWRWLTPISDGIAANLRQELLLFRKYGPLLDSLGDEPHLSVRVSDLADAMDLAPPSLSRAFRRDFGLPLKEFLNRRLNSRACDLLLSTDDSAAAVGRRLGFADELYFYRFFRRMNQMTPVDFRRRNRRDAGS